MKLLKIKLLCLLVYPSLIFSQKVDINGIVTSKGFILPGVEIKTIKGDSLTTTDFDGFFKAKVDLKEKIIFRYLGFLNDTINISNSNKFIKVNLIEDIKLLTDIISPPSGYWISFGTFSDIEFAPFGFSISNGQEEEDLLHFEDFYDDFSFKVSVATDLKSNLTYESRLTFHKPIFRYLLYDLSLEYLNKSYSKINFKDYNLSAKTKYLKPINSVLFLKIGYQEFNDKKNQGFELGLQQMYYNLKLHLGGQIGYWKDYLTYKIFLQKFIYKRKLSLKFNYDRLNNNDFFNFGIRYLFWSNDKKNY